MKRATGVWLVGSVLLAAAIAVSLLYDRSMVRFTPPSLEDFPVQGIDVSHHQGKVDWRKVAALPNVRFAIMKATEGGDFRDRRFAENWRQAKDAGLVRGAYHFFTFCRPGRDQARNIIATVPKEEGTLPIAVDMEFTGNCPRVPTLEELSSEVNAFMAELSGVFPQKPIFYVTQEFYDQYLKGNEALFPEHYLWLRSIALEPAQEGCEEWSIWQFADDGILDGIEGPVDLNALCPTENGLSRFFPPVVARN